MNPQRPHPTMRVFFSTLKSAFQILLGALLVVFVVVVAISFTEHRKIQSLPAGWSILREPGEASALLIRDDTVWVGGRDGLTIIDRTTLAIRATPPGASDLGYIRSLQQAEDGSIWVAHGNGLAQYANGLWHHFSLDGAGLSGPIYVILIEPSGVVWAGGEGGLARRTADAFERIGLPIDAKITAISTIYRDSRGTLWVGSDSNTDGGLLSLNTDGRWRRYAVGIELDHSAINDIAEDRSGQIWIATGFASRGAVSLFKDGAWRKLERHRRGSDRKARSVYEDGAGRIWIGYEYDGLSILDGDTWFDIEPSAGLADEEVKMVRQDDAGTYWIATPNGLSVIKEGAWRLSAR